ncbi:type VII secretion-associated serine protease mycosin [Amycolatopsis sp. NPDC059027]|uniref:type VII secretion-associated serine protease mycosin n=1 Tax=Amycolatopsis sp. NPDC059027 TaxID=3346709 RepID=UPI0036728E4C
MPSSFLARAGALAAALLLGTGPAALADPTVPPLEQVAGGGKCAAPSNTLFSGTPWPQKRLAPQRVWPLTKGEGQLVAVVDSGVDAVPQFAGHVRPVVNIVSPSGKEADCLGHGTFVASLIAAQPREGTGFAGVAPGATILPLRQTDSAGGSASAMAKAIVEAVDAGARVVNISATTFHSSEDLETAVRYASQHDAVIVASAANEAENGNPTAYPAAYPDVIAVSAIAADGSRGRFSETGDFVDLAAPGVDVVGLSAAGTGHVVAQGTSFASPFVAGAAALVRAYHPKLTAQQVKHRLEVTADRPGTNVPDPRVGWGVVNPYAAVTAVLPEEFAGKSIVDDRQVVVPPPALVAPDDPTRLVAMLSAAGAVLVIGVAWVLRGAVPRGRRRGWRSGGSTVPFVTNPTTATAETALYKQTGREPSPPTFDRISK